MTAHTVARRDPQRQAVGTTSYEDAYVWLEDDTAESLAWQSAQDAEAEAHVHSWPGWPALLKAVEVETVDAEVHAPTALRGGRELRRERQPGASQLVLTVFDPDGDVEGRVLVDAGAAGSSLDWFWPSPTGRFVAYGLSQGGDEQSVLHIVDVDTGGVLADRIPHCSHAFVSWLPDDSGFYVAAGKVADQESAQKYLFFHELGGTTMEIETPITLPVHASPSVSGDGRYVALLTLQGLLAPRIAYVLDRTQPAAGWLEFLPPRDRHASGVFVGDTYVAVVKDDTPRGALVAIPVATSLDPETWTTLVPESDAVLIYVHRTGEHLVLEELVDTVSRIRILALDGSEVAVVPLPGVGAVSELQGGGDGDSVTFVFSSLVASAAGYRYRIASRELVEVLPPARRLEGMTVRTVFATSRDGTKIPAHLVCRDRLDSGPRPALIHAYGGFNMPHYPRYLARWVPFVEAGGVYVHAHLRGGSEYGAEWWAGGRLANKQNTFDDLFAVAEHLIETGVSERGRLACYGASNGGLLTAAAVVQRPDLWGAVVSSVPLTDVVRGTRDSYAGMAILLDYGDPEDAEAGPVMLGWSPYQNVREGIAYPPTMVMPGANDFRCPPWHGRKIVAALQHATTGAAPILLRVMKDIGHNTGATLDAAAQAAAEPVAFVMQHLGLQP